MNKELKLEPIAYEEYWVLRGVLEDEKTGCKTVIREEHFTHEPSEDSIIKFLINNAMVSFASVEHNYRLL